MSLSNLTKKGFLWSFLENFSKQGLHFIIGLILARFLTPKDYGLIGICTIFIAIANTFVEGGFGIALVRKKNCTENDYNTVFYFNLIVSLLCYVFLFLLSPSIAKFFDNQELIKIIRILSTGLIFGSLSIIQRTILTKEVNFKIQTKATAIALFLSGVLGVTMAYLGYGVWSLVCQSISYSLINSTFLWFYSPWRPRLIFSKNSFDELFGFGSNLLLTDLINTLYKNAYYVVIGRYFSPASLGFFTRAETTVSLLTNNITHTVKRASYPVLAKLQDDDDALKEIYKKLVKNTMLISASLIFGLAATAKSFILILIGEQWLPSIPYIQLLCFSGIFLPLTIFNLNAINVKGKSRLYLKLQTVNNLMGIPLILLGIFVGIREMLIGFILVALIYYLMNAYFSSKLIKYSVKEQLGDILPILLVSGLVSFIIYFINYLEFHFFAIFIIQFLVALLLTIFCYNIIKQEEYLILRKKILNNFKLRI